MHSLEQLQALSDSELIEKVATEVMAWRKCCPPHCSECEWWCDKDGQDIVASTQCKWCSDNMEYCPWAPLTDWNHTMEVVGKMSEQLFSGRLRFRKAWEHVNGSNMSEALTSLDQRELCIAALLSNGQP